MTRTRAGGIAAAVGVLAMGWAAEAASPPEAGAQRRPPSIVLILADDLGYGDLGCYGQKKFPTPRLDAMAAQGLRFTQFYAGAPVCAPSRCVLLTGRHAGRAVIRGNSVEPVHLKPGTPTLASVLQGAGYATACVGKWGVGSPDNLTNPNDVGFDHFHGYVNMWHAHNCWPEFLIRNGSPAALRNVVAEPWRKWQDPKLPQGGKGVADKRADYAPDLLADDALRFIRENRGKPFFLYFALNLPHANNEAGVRGMEVPDLGAFADKDWPEPEKAFAAAVGRIDRDVGRILDLLKELGIDRDTLVIFTSDNGPHEEGGHKADFFDSNGPLRGIKRDLLEGGIRVPAIAYWPGTVKAGGEDDAHWYFGDFVATAAELAGAKVPDGLDSESFAAVLRGTPRKQRWARKAAMYWECYERPGGAQAVRFGKWKAIRAPMFTGGIELYDMSNDEGEKRDYSKRRPDLTRHAGNLLDKLHQPDPNWKVRAPMPAKPE